LNTLKTGNETPAPAYVSKPKGAFRPSTKTE
jgi:hypothetical protein